MCKDPGVGGNTYSRERKNASVAGGLTGACGRQALALSVSSGDDMFTSAF